MKYDRKCQTCFQILIFYKNLDSRFHLTSLPLSTGTPYFSSSRFLPRDSYLSGYAATRRPGGIKGFLYVFPDQTALGFRNAFVHKGCHPFILAPATFPGPFPFAVYVDNSHPHPILDYRYDISVCIYAFSGCPARPGISFCFSFTFLWLFIRPQFLVPAPVVFRIPPGLTGGTGSAATASWVFAIRVRIFFLVLQLGGFISHLSSARAVCGPSPAPNVLRKFVEFVRFLNDPENSLGYQPSLFVEDMTVYLLYDSKLTALANGPNLSLGVMHDSHSGPRGTQSHRTMIALVELHPVRQPGIHFTADREPHYLFPGRSQAAYFLALYWLICRMPNIPRITMPKPIR